MSQLVRTVPLLVMSLAPAASPQSPSLLPILGAELQRNFNILKEKADPPVYYLAYEVTEVETKYVSAGLGALQGLSSSHHRFLDVTVRVGSPKLDNYHSIRGDQPRFTRGVRIPLDNNPNAIQQRVWLETDRTYRSAVQRLIKIRTDNAVKVAEKDAPADFSPDEPSVYSESPPKLNFAAQSWATRLRKLSAQFSGSPGILTSRVAVVAQRETRYLVNSEGVRLEHGRGFARLSISAGAKAPDGMDLDLGDTFEAVEPGGLPEDKAIVAAIQRVGGQLVQLTRAPVAEPFVGPAILSGRAAGVFFHEIFGHRVEGHRQKDETEGQTFAKSVGTEVLPEFLSVVFDPTRRQVDGVDLNGWYSYDDEGVKARPVPVVEKGILETFLMSRSPIRGISKSNGHGRRQPGLEVVSRQSNLIVESSKQVSEVRLREMLREEAKRQDKDYGLFFQEVIGGYTETARRGIQAFKVIPLVVSKVYADGRPDELIRGADIVGTPLTSFGKILATSDKPEVFNGYCGAESGSVPVSAVSPALLVSELEIQKRESSQDRPPLLPKPAPVGGEQ